MIPVLYFRSSSYNSWDYCQLKYYIVYNLGYNEPTQKKANLGTVAHKVLELLANCKLMIQQNEKKKSFRFNDLELGFDFNFSRTKLNSKKFVKDLLDTCYNYYVTSDPNNNYYNSDYKFCQDMVESCLSYNNGQFDPRKQTIFCPEQHFDIPIDEEWAKFEYEGEIYQLHIKGTIDLIVQLDDKTLELVDYKTGKRVDWASPNTEVKTYEKLCKDPQLLLYHYAISKLFPEFKQTIITIFFLRDGGPFSMCYDEEHIGLFLQKLKDRFNEIRSCKYPKPINYKRNDFRCKILCDFYKRKWEGSDEPTMCHHIEKHIKVYGIEETSKKLKKDGHFLNKYKAPGEVDNEK